MVQEGRECAVGTSLRSTRAWFDVAKQLVYHHRASAGLGKAVAAPASLQENEVNTANEYWVKAGSLLHTDTHGKDLTDPDNVRYYLMSGLAHGVGNATAKSTCQQFLNPVSPYRAHPALLVALD